VFGSQTCSRPSVFYLFPFIDSTLVRRPDVLMKQHRNHKCKKRRASKNQMHGVQRVVISFGAAKVGSMSHIEGSMTGPHKKLLERLSQMPDVLVGRARTNT